MPAKASDAAQASIAGDRRRPSFGNIPEGSTTTWEGSEQWGTQHMLGYSFILGDRIP
jgi:hypothetical protein